LEAQVRLGKDRLDQDSIGKDSMDESAKPTVKKFTPPTLQEVIGYCNERKNKVDPQRFINHYTSNGWMVGRNKMKDWKAAVRTWENNDKPKSNKTSQDKTLEAYYRKADEI
jgi:hypothetical protein